MDSARPRGEDLSTTKARTKYLNLLQLGYYDIVAISALCYFLSGDLGYSAEPRGLARLTTATFLRILLLRWPGLRLTRLFFFVMEQPEDLGAMPAGPHQGHRPATMWQWPQHGELVNLGLRSVCLHQSSFGVGYHKPTRLLLKTSLSMPDFVFEGLPMFDDGGYYTGPLPKLATTSTAATGRMVASQATAQWPTKMPSGLPNWPWLPALLLLRLPFRIGSHRRS